MTTSRKMMGFEVPGDERVPVPVRDWRGMKLALWRSKAGWEIAGRMAEGVLERCSHAEGCAGIEDETAPCDPNCVDREMRMSALVILNAARMFGPLNTRKPADEPYYAPSREYFSDILGELGAAQAELEALRGGAQTIPPTNDEPDPETVLLPQMQLPLQLEEAT